MVNVSRRKWIAKANGLQKQMDCESKWIYDSKWIAKANGLRKQMDVR